MKVQVVVHDRVLKDFYGIRLWKIYDVIKVKETRKATYYYIETIHTWPHNHQGQKAIIRLTEKEVKIL